MDKLQIINAALTQTGNNPLTKWDQASPEGIVIRANYEIEVLAELECAPYSFARKTAYLTKKVEGNFEYAFGNALPEDSIKVRNLYLIPAHCKGERAIGCYRCDDWDEVGCEIHWGLSKRACADNICPLIEYTHRPDEAKWPPNFVKAISQRMQAVILRAINEENGEARNADNDAEFSSMKARLKSSKRKNEIDPDARRVGRIDAARRGHNRKGLRYGSK